MASRPQAPPESVRRQVCDLCTTVPWFLLPPEDLPGHPHHASLEALVLSARTCPLCDLVLFAAVSNHRRSLTPPGETYRWRRYEKVLTTDDLKSGIIREAAYVKQLGPCKPRHESDHCPGRGGFFNTSKDAWDMDMNLNAGPGRTVFLAAIGMEERNGEEPVEDAPIDLAELRRAIPLGHGIWLYGNWWVPTGPKGIQADDLQCMGVGARFGATGHMFDSINNPKRHILIRGSALSLLVGNSEGNTRFRVPRRPRELDSQSGDAFRRLSEWIKACETTHECGPAQKDPPLPSRVIDVSGPGSAVKLVETRGQKGRYIALSHSWGKSARLVATKSNLDDLTRRILLSALPKTFRDAVKATRKLGIKYLWIDCLCIIQDDPQDWEKEAAAMGALYHDSYLTISAAACTDSFSGCFPERAERGHTSPASLSLGYKTKVDVSGPDTCSFTMRSAGGENVPVHLIREWLPGSINVSPQIAVIGRFGRNFDPIASEPLSCRGWTLQERLLPKRIVHYAQDQMYFECEQILQSEDGFVFTNEFFNLSKLLATQGIRGTQHGGTGGEGIRFAVDGVIEGIRWKGGWVGLVQDYSRRQLTVPHDKLPALAGLARILAEKTGDDYFAGVWAAHIFEDLFWRVYLREETFHNRVPLKGKVLGEVSKPATYRAPSWSWASIDAPLQFIPLGFRDLVARIIRCETTPSGDDRYGSVKDGRLVIEGPVHEISPHSPNPKQPRKRHGTPVEIRFDDPDDDRHTAVGALFPDFPEEPLHYPCFALFIDASNALVLRPRVDATLPDAVDTILTSSFVRQHLKAQPERANWVFQAIGVAERIGVVSFDYYKPSSGDDDEGEEREKKDEEPIDLSKLTLDDICYAEADRAWYNLTKDDPRNNDPTAYYAAYAVAKQKHLAGLLARINVQALEEAASRARGGVACKIPLLASSLDSTSRVDRVSRQSGGQNCHLDVEFADGVTWLARIRLDDPLLPPPAVQAYIFLSEVATLKFLENTAVPASRVYAYEEADAPGNAVGTSYVLMEKLPGKPLDWGRATGEGRAHVLEQLADLYLELEKHPIPLTGSLIPSSGRGSLDVDVGGFAQTPCFSAPDRTLGPFGTLNEAYSTIIHQQQNMITTHEVSSLQVDNYLAFLWRLKALPELVSNSVSRAGLFYLKHYDDKGDHLLVDEAYNITGVIDWEFASAEAKELAFSSPCMAWPVGDFYDGNNVLADDEEKFAAIFERRGRADMAAIVRVGRRWQRYLFFLGGGIPRDMAEFEPLFQGLRKSFLGEGGQKVVSSYEEWKQGALAEFSDGDVELQALLRNERAKGRKASASLVLDIR